MSLRFLNLLVASIALPCLVTACDGPSLPAAIRDEPVCKDVQQAGETLKGGFKKPVRLRVIEGEDIVATVMIYGVPSSSPGPTRFLLPGRDETYKLEWAQCSNERALTTVDPRDKAALQKSGNTKGVYDCADPKTYETVEHTVKKGDTSTHELKLAPPPEPGCW